MFLMLCCDQLLVWNQHSQQPMLRLTEHTAAVKAIAWSPHQSNLLASGGGTADRCIRFWNTTNGHQLNHVDTGSQVSVSTFCLLHVHLSSKFWHKHFSKANTKLQIYTISKSLLSYGNTILRFPEYSAGIAGVQSGME